MSKDTEDSYIFTNEDEEIWHKNNIYAIARMDGAVITGKLISEKFPGNEIYQRHLINFCIDYFNHCDRATKKELEIIEGAKEIFKKFEELNGIRIDFMKMAPVFSNLFIECGKIHDEHKGK